MKTIIGINVETKTAREQELLVSYRECRAYYEDAYNGSLKEHAKKIIAKYVDCSWEIGMNTTFLKDGCVCNTIIFGFYNEKGFNKKELRVELDNYIQGKFKCLFNGA